MLGLIDGKYNNHLVDLIGSSKNQGVCLHKYTWCENNMKEQIPLLIIH